MPRAALFDLDRTLVRKETASLYVRYQRERGEATAQDALQVFYWVLQYTAGVIDAPEVAARALQRLRGVPEVVLASRCDDWYRTHVERYVCDEARRAVEHHRAKGHVLAVVTGATVYVTRPVARALGIPHLVTSELEVDDEGCFTGRFVPPLCYAEGKIARIRDLSKEQGFSLSEATFYSDSYTDLPLLERVAEPVCVNPDFRLRRVARARGWRIERW